MRLLGHGSFGFSGLKQVAFCFTKQFAFSGEIKIFPEDQQDRVPEPFRNVQREVDDMLKVLYRIDTI